MTGDLTFGEWLKRRRRQMDLTQRELAEQAGCSVGTIQKIEQDLRRPSKQLAELLATQLDIPLEQLPAFITFARTEAYTAEMSDALATMGEIPLEPQPIPLQANKVEPEAVPQPPSPQVATNLPVQATPFIGRETELDELDALIANPDVRLVTIVGAGGMGKTRLALAAGERQLQNNSVSAVPPPHGVFFVDLARLEAGGQVILTLADALNFPLRSGEQEKRTPRQQILDYLRRKQMLLIIDNFEHVLDEAELVADILQRAPAVQVLVTSRERLQLQGEHLFAIQGLAFPDWETGAGIPALEDAVEYTAVKLFLQSARRLRRNFQLQADDLTYLSRICRLVEGMPLAVELAAGWVDLLSLAEIAAELAKSLDMLETDMRDVPQRQRSLRAVFDTSWGRLSQAEQAALMGFSRFRRGCTRDAAQAVTGASLRTLANLSNKSLIQYRQRNGRYQIHTLLRQYAAEKLAGDEMAETAVKDAHCTYYCAILEQWEKALMGYGQIITIEAIRADYDNIQTAWEWAVTNMKVADLTRAVNGWGEYVDAIGYWSEGENIFQKAAQAVMAAHRVIESIDMLRLYVRLQTWYIKFGLNLTIGSILGNLRYQEDLEHLLGQNLSLLSDWTSAAETFQAEEAFIRLQLGRMQRYGSERQIAEGWTNLETSLHLYQQLEDDAGIANALYEIGLYHRIFGSPEQARKFLLQSLSMFQAVGDSWRLVSVLNTLQRIAYDMGDATEALELLEQWSDVTVNLNIYGNTLAWAGSLREIDSQLVHSGRFAEARELSKQYLAVYNELGMGELQLALSHATAGFPLLYLGQYVEAQEKARKSLGLYVSGNENLPAWAFTILGWVALAEEAYGEASQWLTKVCQMEKVRTVYSQVVGQAKATLALAERGLGQSDQAKRHLFEVLKTTITDKDLLRFLPLIKALSGIALLLADQGHTERAVEVYALARTHPMVANGQWFEDVAGRHIKAISATLPPEVVRTAEARGQAAELWQGSVALLAELEALGWGT